MKILPCALTLLTLCLSAAEAGEPMVKVEHGWIQAVPPVAGDSVAYLTLVNLSDHELRMNNATTPIAQTVLPMVTVKTIRNGSEMVGMKEVNELAVVAHGRLSLVPGGSHLMLVKLKSIRQSTNQVRTVSAPGLFVTIKSPRLREGAVKCRRSSATRSRFVNCSLPNVRDLGYRFSSRKDFVTLEELEALSADTAAESAVKP